MYWKSTLSNGFKKVVVQRLYHFGAKSAHYYDVFSVIVAKWLKCLPVQMKSHVFDFLDLTPILGFFVDFNFPCTPNVIDKKAAM